MEKIAITGGKGGTGKSTVAVLLANKFVSKGKRVVLCDLDVECPNDYLLLGQKLKNRIGKVYAEFPKLNKTKCRKCGLCVRNCRSNAIFQAPGQYPIFIYDLCSGCGLCSRICPYGAIELKKKVIGEIYLNRVSKDLHLVTGVAKAGLEETGPVVRGVKKIALKLARKVRADIVLFDTSAGIHCPVIAALQNVDYAYVITEPTPLGAYDLALILDLCRKLSVKAKIVLNQANLGDKRIVQKVLEKFKIKKFTFQIPYSEKIVRAYSQGKLLEFLSKEF